MELMAFAQTAWLAGWQQAVLLGVWFGLLHALDPDHLATIGGLAVTSRSLTPTGYALRWAVGHGAALAAIAALVLGLHLAAVARWTSYGDLLVCLVLLALGVQALRAVWRRRQSERARRSSLATQAPARAATHAHVGVQPHLHFFAPFHTHESGAATRDGPSRRIERASAKGLTLGVIHGGAGSAAVLALLPLAHFRSGLESALYLLCFSFGVGLGALAFAHVFALASRRTLAAGERLAAGFQTAVGVLAIASGVWLATEILRGGG